MKILKSNTQQIFDTDNIDFMEHYKGREPTDVSKALHHNHELTDYEFLSKFFPSKHRIFDDFSESFYWIINL